MFAYKGTRVSELRKFTFAEDAVGHTCPTCNACGSVNIIILSKGRVIRDPSLGERIGDYFTCRDCSRSECLLD